MERAGLQEVRLRAGIWPWCPLRLPGIRRPEKTDFQSSRQHSFLHLFRRKLKQLQMRTFKTFSCDPDCLPGTLDMVFLLGSLSRCFPL